MPEATAVLDRERPIVEDPERLRKIREDVDKRVEYSKEVRERAEKNGIKLPETTGEIRKGLDAKAAELINQSKEDEKERKKEVPDIVLSQQSEEFWEQIGWEKTSRTEVIQKLMNVLDIKEPQAISAMECLVAEGKTPNEVLDSLNSAPSFDPSPDEEERLYRRMQSDRVLANSGDPRSVKKIDFIEEKLGIKNATYVHRFILNEELKEGLNAYRNQNPAENLFDIAWNIMAYGQGEKYGMDKDFPLLQMQIKYKTDDGGNRIAKRDKEGNPLKNKKGEQLYEMEGRYVINEANFLRWVRGRMFERWDVFETDDPVDFYSVLEVYRGQYSSINLAAMIFDSGRYFRDEKGYKWDDLYNQVFIEPFMLMYDRRYDIEYRNAQGDSEALIKAYKSMADLSKWTRKINGQSMLDRSLMLPVDFTGKDSDAKLGESLLTMFLVYYNLVDFDALEQILGKDSDFFQRQTWVDAAQEVAAKTMNQAGGAWMSHVFGDREDNFYKAFDKEGNVVDKKEFVKLVNPFYQETVPQSLIKALEVVVKKSVEKNFISKEVSGENKDKNVLDKDSLNYAWLKAYSWMRFTGGVARNNFVDKGGPAGYLEETKYLYTDSYRLKYETYGGAGNFFTDFMFKQMGIPLLEGMLLENAFERTLEKYDENGKPVFIKKKRFRTPMEVMLEMRRKNAEIEHKITALQKNLKDKTGDEAESIEKQIAHLEDEAKNYTKAFANMLEFGDNAMSVWAKNLLARGSNLYTQVMKGQETAFDKFMKYDSVFRGVSFDREAWQGALQDKLITPLRYFFEANGATQLNMKVRAPVLVGWSKGKDPKPLWEWKEQYLGERMLGHQIVDIPHFRMKAADAKARGEWEPGWRKRGKYVVDENGRHVIDWDDVQANKTIVWKQWMLMKLGADLWSHIDRHSTDPAYGMDHYMNILEAIENLHGNIEGDEFNLKNARIKDRLFDHHQIQWLKRISGTTTLKLFNRAFWSSLFMDKHRKDSLFGESTSIIIGAIFRGK